MLIKLRLAPGSLGLFFLLSLPFVFSQDVPMFRGDPRHTGVYEGAGGGKLGGLKWKFHTGGMVIGSPVVVNGNVYFGSDDGNFYAVDAETGAQKWVLEARSRIPSTPAVDGGTVYFGVYSGSFLALDAGNGSLKWKFKTGGERRFAGKHLHGVQPLEETMPDPYDSYLSSPVVWNHAVYFGSGDGNIYSLNAAT